MRIQGVGIDLVSISRMRRFVKSHGLKAAELLDPSLTSGSVKKISVKKMARLFAAKEAVFKTLDRSWMGLAGFRDIKVYGSPHSGFSVECPFLPPKTAVSGCFFEGEKWVGAQVILWSVE